MTISMRKKKTYHKPCYIEHFRISCNDVHEMKSMTVFSYIWCCIYLFRFRNYHSNIRTKDAIEATGAYDRPQYDPGPSHCRCSVRFNTSYSFKLNSCNLITVTVCENVSFFTGHCDRQEPHFYLSQHFLPMATTSP